MKPRPKFCVGEEVACSHGPTVPSCSKTEVVKARFYGSGEVHVDASGRRFMANDWYYELAHCGGKMVIENRVRKLTPEERTQWKDCAWQPNNEEVTA